VDKQWPISVRYGLSTVFFALFVARISSLAPLLGSIASKYLPWKKKVTKKHDV
jgi:hypothetical protein